MAPLELMSMAAVMGEDGNELIQELEARRLLGLLLNFEPTEKDEKRDL